MKNSGLEPQRITVPHTLGDYFPDRPYLDFRLGGFHVEHYPIELQIHSVMPSYSWDEGTKTLGLDFLESTAPFDDKENGLKIVFSEISHPDTTFEFDLINRMRNPSA